ncbi:hypothetical protein [Methylobacterium gnaphalii]|uniref:Uncharacterized protein n=1 Tax=Methylobacterium gnaphalii TaxID=1010610 RepID=A0A512JKY9_9HYPH|nr:hypothetical protein [Methylobacterium gnaphalii]GEP10629.1 hypothetical protein MGN01_24740 [Methylobacterium gnaphalii]GJD68202.1 hypothetical protein MMMDOFMJ_1121 [Methylobacterium gnaphalii]GLS51685.1 hypothetical protein GCM10007885_45450 [Methylobacterium gnaphalii]
MAHNSSSGRTPGLSMAEFNARAKKVAAATGEIEKGETRRATPSRFRRDNRPAAPKAEETSESET